MDAKSSKTTTKSPNESYFISEDISFNDTLIKATKADQKL
jgi:hypothetical protein